MLLQVSRLQKNVDDLQHALLKSLHDRQPTVIYAGQNKSGCVPVPPMQRADDPSSTVWMLLMMQHEQQQHSLQPQLKAATGPCYTADLWLLYTSAVQALLAPEQCMVVGLRCCERVFPAAVSCCPPACSLGTATGVVLVIGGVALYIRFVKGWRFSDLMYVTRSSLTSLTESMKTGGWGCRLTRTTCGQWDRMGSALQQVY